MSRWTSRLLALDGLGGVTRRRSSAMQQSSFMIAPWGTLALVAHSPSVPTVLSSHSHLGRPSRTRRRWSFRPQFVCPQLTVVYGRRKRHQAVYRARERWHTVLCWCWANRRAHTRRGSKPKVKELMKRIETQSPEQQNALQLVVEGRP